VGAAPGTPEHEEITVSKGKPRGGIRERMQVKGRGDKRKTQKNAKQERKPPPKIVVQPRVKGREKIGLGQRGTKQNERGEDQRSAQKKWKKKSVVICEIRRLHGVVI